MLKAEVEQIRQIAKEEIALAAAEIVKEEIARVADEILKEVPPDLKAKVEPVLKKVIKKKANK